MLQLPRDHLARWLDFVQIGMEALEARRAQELSGRAKLMKKFLGIPQGRKQALGQFPQHPATSSRPKDTRVKRKIRRKTRRNEVELWEAFPSTAKTSSKQQKSRGSQLKTEKISPPKPKLHKRQVHDKTQQPTLQKPSNQRRKPTARATSQETDKVK